LGWASANSNIEKASVFLIESLDQSTSAVDACSLHEACGTELRKMNMVNAPLVILSKNSSIANVTLNRAAKRNALSTRVLAELIQTLNDIADDFPTTRVVILTGAGQSFCSGADIAEFEGWDASSLFKFIELGSTACQILATMPQPVIAGIHGHALGGGLELALAADIRIADATASFGFPEINIGGVPGWGGTIRLQEVIGRGQAGLMLLTGKSIDSATAQSIGLLQQVVTEDQLASSCQSLAETLASKSPTALRLVKRALNSGSPYDPRRQANIEQYANLACMLSEERHRAVQSFNAKSSPDAAPELGSPHTPGITN
jgi:enoyl-CoA hydratase/carnithine racemase